MEKEPQVTRETSVTTLLSACIFDLMSDGIARTLTEISAALNVSNGRARRALAYLEALNEIHVCRRLPGSHKKIYLIAPDLAPTRQHQVALADSGIAKIVDVVFPEDDREHEAALDRRYRSNGAWWPAADSTVVAAMSALTRPIGHLAADNIDKQVVPTASHLDNN